MRIICSWCRGEGQIGLIGEKAPLEDRRETHSICITHRLAVQARCREALRLAEGIDRRLALVGAASDTLSTGTGDRRMLSATYLWTGLKNFAWKSRS